MEMKGISHRSEQSTDEECARVGEVHALWYHFA